MDSLRNLSNSLPSRRHEKQTAELLSSFKAAALSVTNLYKTAANDQAKARSAGYQDALDDLLTFLDNEKLGLMDGEGWRIRGWATERLDDGASARHTERTTDDEFDGGDTADQTRSSSPEMTKKANIPVVTSALTEESVVRYSSEPPRPQQTLAQQQQLSTGPGEAEFTFRTAQMLPTNHERNAGMELDNASNGTTNNDGQVSLRPTLRNRRDRHNTHQRRRETQQPQGTLSLNLGNGAGSKRKMPYPDFFDISGDNGDGTDPRTDSPGSNGGAGRASKRWRHV